MKKIKRLIPDLHISSALDLDFSGLMRNGIKLILFDIDNTLIPHGGKIFGSFASEVIAKASDAGIECILFSNAGKIRLQEIAKTSGLDHVKNPMKPFSKGIRRLLTSRPELSPGNIAVVGDQLFTDILAGRNAGVFTVLVDPVSEREPFHIKVRRIIEKPFKKRIAID